MRRPTHNRRSRTLWGAVLLLVAIGGCGGSDHASVSGTVLRHDDSPVAGAYVIARSAETGAAARGMTDDAGHFELGTTEQGDGVPPGDYYVIIVEERQLDDTRPPTIPSKYSSSTGSGLQLSVAAGEQKEFDVKLDPK